MWIWLEVGTAKASGVNVAVGAVVAARRRSVRNNVTSGFGVAVAWRVCEPRPRQEGEANLNAGMRVTLRVCANGGFAIRMAIDRADRAVSVQSEFPMSKSGRISEMVGGIAVAVGLSCGMESLSSEVAVSLVSLFVGEEEKRPN